MSGPSQCAIKWLHLWCDCISPILLSTLEVQKTDGRVGLSAYSFCHSLFSLSLWKHKIIHVALCNSFKAHLFLFYIAKKRDFSFVPPAEWDCFVCLCVCVSERDEIKNMTKQIKGTKQAENQSAEGGIWTASWHHSHTSAFLCWCPFVTEWHNSSYHLFLGWNLKKTHCPPDVKLFIYTPEQKVVMPMKNTICVHCKKKNEKETDWFYWIETAEHKNERAQKKLKDQLLNVVRSFPT